LTLCIIAKNEAKGLRRAVESAAPMVRETIIGVDTTSNDNTLDIARSLTPNVFLFSFKNDFSEARNNLAATAKTGWILWLDGHEYINKSIDFAKTQSPDADGFLIAKQYNDGPKFYEPKILRRDVKFAGAIHEQPQCKKVAQLLEPLIIHDRPGGQAAGSIQIKNEQREKMMNEIMLAELRKNKKNLHAIFQMAIYRQGTGKLKEACHYFEQYLKYQPKNNPNFMVYLNFALCLIGRGRIDTARRVLARGVEKCGQMWELNLLAGEIEAGQNHHRQAIVLFNKALIANTGHQLCFPLIHEPHKILDMIAREHYLLKEFENAFMSWRGAADIAPDEELRKLYLKRAAVISEILRPAGAPIA